MQTIHVTAKLNIHDGKLARFKEVAQRCAQTVREKDNGTLQYDWFLSSDQSVCEVREKYRDSSAVLEHMGNLGDTLGELLSISDLSLEVYGSPSKTLLGALEGLDVKFYSHLISA